MCARAYIFYINRVWRVVLVVISANLYFSLSASIVFLRPGKRDKVLTALLVLRYTSSSVAAQGQMMRRGVVAFSSPSEDFVIATARAVRSCVSVYGGGGACLNTIKIRHRARLISTP